MPKSKKAGESKKAILSRPSINGANWPSAKLFWMQFPGGRESAHCAFRLVEPRGAGRCPARNGPQTCRGYHGEKEQRDSIERYIKSAIDEGAKLECGGRRPTGPAFDKGYYLTPTVFTDLTPNMTIAREEVFGPVVGFFRFSDDEKVLEAANDSVFGLCASVWTKDYARGLKFVNGLQAGSVWINQHMNLVAETPWGGFKESGLMKEGGVIGPEGYAQLKYVCIKHSY